MKYACMLSLLVLASCTTAPKTDEPVADVDKPGNEVPSLFSTVPGSKTVSISSGCKAYGWGNRGKAPLGYLTGLGLVQMRGETRAMHGSVIGMPLGKPETDSLAYYYPEFRKLGVPLNTPQERAAAVYLLLVGLGMRESSGNYLEGWDVNGDRKESGAEAGLFQSSYNSLDDHPEIQKLYDEYRDDISGCLLKEFQPGSHVPTGQNSKPLGTGAGRDFQIFTKACPAFATEHAAIMVRINGGSKGHYGPIRRKEAEIRAECYQ